MESYFSLVLFRLDWSAFEYSQASTVIRQIIEKLLNHGLAIVLIQDLCAQKSYHIYIYPFLFISGIGVNVKESINIYNLKLTKNCHTVSCYMSVDTI